MTLPAPIYSADAHEGITPHKYLAIERKQQCSTCHAVHTWTETYALTYLRPREGLGKLISNLRRLDQPRYRLPIEQVPATKVDMIPFCHACVAPSLDNVEGLLEPPKSIVPGVIGLAAKPDLAKRKQKRALANITIDQAIEEFLK